MKAPPATSCTLSVPPPRASAESDANSTSLSITTAVRFAGRRAAPYCSARLPARKRTVSPAVQSSHAPTTTGGEAIAPPVVRAAASAPQTIAAPANIAIARPSSGRSASRRSITLLNANEAPPTRPSQSASVAGNGSRAASPASALLPVGQRTMAAPTTPRTMRSAAARVSRSPRTRRARSTVQSGIR